MMRVEGMTSFPIMAAFCGKEDSKKKTRAKEMH